MRGDSSKILNISLEDLYIFRSVVREGGARRKLATVRPSNVTTMIKQSEGRLGVQLFRMRSINRVLEKEPELTAYVPT